MNIKEKLKKSIIGKLTKWLLRSFLSWRFYFKQLFWSYQYYQTKRLANSCDIKCTIKYVGKRSTKFPHPVGVVIGMGVKLGNHCTIFQNSTLGTKKMNYGDDYPVLGDHVIVGANVLVIGKVTIGNHVTIGASTLVLSDVPDYAIVAGNPMKILGFKKEKGYEYGTENK